MYVESCLPRGCQIRHSLPSSLPVPRFCCRDHAWTPIARTLDLRGANGDDGDDDGDDDDDDDVDDGDDDEDDDDDDDDDYDDDGDCDDDGDGDGGVLILPRFPEI